jgi:hypothetical protein
MDKLIVKLRSEIRRLNKPTIEQDTGVVLRALNQTKWSSTDEDNFLITWHLMSNSVSGGNLRRRESLGDPPGEDELGVNVITLLLFVTVAGGK